MQTLIREQVEGNAGKIIRQFSQTDCVIIDELGYIPFPKSSGALLFHLISKLYENTSVIITTNLEFGEWVDNRMIERLWRALKYECVYINAFETGSETRAGIGKWLAYYKTERPHSAHGILTPKEAYERKPQPMRLAA